MEGRRMEGWLKVCVPGTETDRGGMEGGREGEREK